MRWFGTLKEVEDKCSIHSGLPSRYFVSLKELKREVKSKIRDLKMKKEKVNEEIEFHKEVLNKIDEAK